jgi:hypothetical protein
MRVVGTVRSGKGTRVDCQKPLRAVCRNKCDHVEFWRCDSYGCGPCGNLKQRRLARLADNGASLHLASGMNGYFLTLTAPGISPHKRWYQGKRPSSRVDCDCHDNGMPLAIWNTQESACWNRLRTALTREQRMIFCGAVETQKRGALHRHVLVFVEDELDVQDLQDLAQAAGYGCVIDVERVRSAGKAARYISKYVTKAATERAEVPWQRLDPETGELVEKGATYRLWSSSRAWGITMKEIRATQAAQAAARSMYLRELAIATGEDVAAAAGLKLADSPSLSPP